MAFREITPLAYARLSARQLGRLVASRRVSPVQLVDCALHLAKAAEKEINAYVALMEPYAKRIAAQREKEARAGKIRSPLHGVPIAIKDNFYLKGFPPSRGSRTGDGRPASYDSPVVERILAAGAVIIGRTTLPEFGWKGTGISPLTGVTRNPWNTARNTGGSSAGSAATVAAGAVPIALGSDAGGSVRIPASFCGVVGLKPTLGRIPVYPGTVTETLSHAGPLCRTVDDAALVHALTAGPDPRDPLSFGAQPVRPDARLARLRAGKLRIGVVAAPFGIEPEKDVRDVFERALKLLRKSIKAEFRKAAIDAALPREIFETLWVTGRGLGFADSLSRHADIMDPGLVRVGKLAADVSLAKYFKAIDARRKFNAAAFAVFDSVDALVMPTMPLVAFDAAAEVPPGGEDQAPLPWVTWTPFTYPFNISGQPALSLPCGFAPGGMPVGLQIVGPWAGDDLVLALARRVEAALAASLGSTLSPVLMRCLGARGPK